MNGKAETENGGDFWRCAGGLCAWVKMYHPSGALVTIPLPVSQEQAREVLAGVDAALAAGFAVNAPGSAGEDEKIEDVTGWVRGETGDGGACVYLYGGPALQYRIATVWPEDIGLLPFSNEVTRATVCTGSPPRRDAAVRNGYFHSIAGRVVLKKDGVTSKGATRWRFSRWDGYRPPADGDAVDGAGAKPGQGRKMRPITPADLVEVGAAKNEETARQMIEAIKKRLSSSSDR